jgi:hypothetical protein
MSGRLSTSTSLQFAENQPSIPDALIFQGEPWQLRLQVRADPHETVVRDLIPHMHERRSPMDRRVVESETYLET